MSEVYDIKELIHESRKAAKCIYIAAEKPAADDASAKLRALCDVLEGVLTHVPVLRALDEAGRRATPHEWYKPHICDDSHSCDCKAILSEGYFGGIASVGVDNGKRVSEGGNDCPPIEEARANAEFICAAANARSDIASLLSRLDPASKSAMAGEAQKAR